MGSLEERLNNPNYKLWIKAGICLASLKEGIEKFADERSKKVHDFVKMAVAKTKLTNDICPNRKVYYSKRKKNWTLGCCWDCDVYVKEIINYRTQSFRFEEYNWDNSDPQYWPAERWEMMKVYMNKGQKEFPNQLTSNTTDLSGLLNFIAHCSVPWVDIQNKDTIQKVRGARNAIMHSATMKISNDDLSEYTDAMINLLKDPLFMNKIQEAQDAIKTIQEIMKMEFIISPKDEYNVLREKTMSINEQHETLQEEVNSLKDRYSKINALLYKETGTREETEEVLKREINEKEKQIKELSTELSWVKKLIDQDIDLHSKMNVRVEKIEKALDMTGTKFRQFKQLIETQKNKQPVTSENVDVQTIREENEQLRELISRLEVEDGDLRIENDKLKDRISSLVLVKSKREMQLITQQQVQEKEIKNLKEINRKLNEELKGMKTSDSKTECTSEKCRNSLEILEYENETLKSTNKELTTKKIPNESEGDFEKDNVRLNYKIIEMMRTKDELNNSLTLEKIRRQILEQRLYRFDEEKQTTASEKQMADENKTLKKAMEISEQNRVQREAELEKVHLENKHLEESLSQKDAKILKLEETKRRLEEDKRTLASEKEREFETFNQEAENLRIHIDKGEADKETYKQDLTKSKAEIQKLISQTEHLEQALSEKDAEILKFEETKTKLEEEKQTLASKKELELETFNQEAKNLRMRIDKCEKDKETYEQDLTKSKAEIQKLISQTEHLEHALSEKDAEILKLKETLSKLDEEKQTLASEKERELEKFNQDAEKLRIRIDECVKEEETYEQDLIKSKAEIQKLISQKDQDAFSQKVAESGCLETTESSRDSTRREIDVVIAKQVSTRVSDDHDKALISGAMFLSEGDLVVCDGGNKKIKVFSRIFDMKSSLLLESKPWDLAELSRNLLAVTLPDTKQLIYLEVHPILQQTKAFKLDKMCWGIAVSENDLYVTHFNKHGEVGVIILDIDGHEKKSINAHSDTFFVNPEYLAVSIGGLIHVSDKDLNSVTIIDSKGSIIRHYKEPDLEKPGGICFDHSGNFIICGTSSNNLHIVSTDGRKLKIVRTQENLLCVAYRKDNMLVIGCDNDELLVLKLEDSWQKKIE